MKKIFFDYILFLIAILFYFAGWIFKSQFIIGPLFFFISIILFILIFNKNAAKQKFLIFNQQIKSQSTLVFILKIISIIILYWLAVYFFNLKKDILALVSLTFCLFQIALLFRGKGILFSEVEEKQIITQEDNKKKIIKNFIKLGLSIIFIFILYLSYLLSKNGMVFISGFIFLIGITGFGYFFNFLDKEHYENKLFNNTYFNFFVLFLLLIIAAILRLYKISEIPDGYSLDEQLISAYAGPVFQGQRIPIFIADARFQVASLFYYIVGQIWKIFSSSIDSARVLAALIGVLNVLFIYLLAKELFNNKRVAILSAFFMTFSYYHLIYSRIAWLWIFVPTLATATIYFYLLGERTGKYIYFMISGALLGLNLYFYNAAKMVAFVFAFYWLFLLLRSRETRDYLLNNKKSLFVFILSSIIVFIPLVIFIYKYPAAYFERIKEQSILKGNIFSAGFQNFFFSHAKDTVLMFIAKASKYGYYNYPNKPLLDFISGFLYILGISYTFYNWKKTKNFLLILLFFFSLVPAFFSYHPSDPNTQRAILSVVPLILFISLGTEIIIKTIEFIKIRMAGLIALILFITISVFIIYDNLYTYFYLYKNDNDVKAEFFYIPSKVIKFVNNSKDYFNMGSFFYLETPNFYVNNGIYFKFFDFAAMRFYEWLTVPKKNLQFILEGLYNKVVEIVKEYIPDAKIERHWDFYSDIKNKKYFYRIYDEFEPNLLFISVKIPEESLKLFHTLNVKYYKGMNIIGDIKINQAEIPILNEAEKIEINSMIDLPYYSNYKFYCEGIKDYDLYLDGVKILNEKKYAAGLHKIKIIVKIEKPQNLIIKWECQEYGLNGKIPTEYFVNSEKIFGLKAEYYIDGEKVSEQIDPIITHRVYYMASRIKAKKWQNKHEIIWSGKIFIPSEVITYLLDTEFDSKIEIDNKEIFSIKNKAGNFNYLKGDNNWHKIKIYYSYSGLPVLTNKRSAVKFLYKLKDNASAFDVPVNYIKPE
jgi:4-amino-4-deoxy-L-arabinose transferase-like glycosyltransferase